MKLLISGTDSIPDESVMPNAGAANITVDNLLALFFKKTKTSEAAGRAWWDRIHERTKETSGEDRTEFVSEGFADGGCGNYSPRRGTDEGW